jgi:hypothetical protein
LDVLRDPHSNPISWRTERVSGAFNRGVSHAPVMDMSTTLFAVREKFGQSAHPHMATNRSQEVHWNLLDTIIVSSFLITLAAVAWWIL